MKEFNGKNKVENEKCKNKLNRKYKEKEL